MKKSGIFPNISLLQATLDTAQILQHSGAVAPDIHLAFSVIYDGYRVFTDLKARPPGDENCLKIEGKSIHLTKGKDLPRGTARETLDAALGIAVLQSAVRFQNAEIRP